MKFTIDFYLRQINSIPSINGNILDLVLTKFPKEFYSAEKEDIIFNSDHYVLSFYYTSVKRFHSYQRVILDGCTSERLPVISGVSQGSIVRPLPFSLYINDLPNVIKKSKKTLYAHDTVMVRLSRGIGSATSIDLFGKFKTIANSVIRLDLITITNSF